MISITPEDREKTTSLVKVDYPHVAVEIEKEGEGMVLHDPQDFG